MSGDGLRKLAIALAVLVIVALFGRCVAHAAPPAHAGTGGPLPHARNGKAVKADPDDNAKGPERGDGTADLQDWNNGCGNDEDRTDDNEGWCGRGPESPPVNPRVSPPRPIISPVRPVHHNCTVILWGETPEVFHGGIDVRNPANEKFVLAEANGYLEFHGNDGTEYQVLWWDNALGHGSSHVTEFTCHGVITLYEPLDGAL